MRRLKTITEDYDIRRGAGFLGVALVMAVLAWLVYPMASTALYSDQWATMGGFYALCALSVAFLLGAVGSVIAAGVRELMYRAELKRTQ